MATCYNRTTTEYKSLLTEYKNPLTVDSIINDFQSLEKTDNIPSLSEARNMVEGQLMLRTAKSSKVGQILLKNLRNQNYLKKIGDEYFIIEPRRSDAKRVNDRIKSFLKYNGFQQDSILFRPTKVPNMYRAVVNTNAKFNMTNVASKDSAKALPILDHLKKMFPGIDYIVLDPTTARNIYNTIPHLRKRKIEFEKINSFFFDGTAVLIKGKVTQATAIEEMLHPFVDALQEGNRELFDNLLSEGLEIDTELADEIIGKYEEEYGYNVEDRQLEFVTQILTKHFNNEYDKKPISFLRAVREFLNWFADAIKSLYSVLTGEPLSVKQINSGMSLSDVAKMLNTDKLKFDVKPTTQKDVRYSLSKGTEAILEKIKSHAATAVQSQIADQLFHQAYSSEVEIEQLATSRVLEQDGDFVNVDTGETLPRVEDSLLGLDNHVLKGKDKTFGEDTEMFFNNLTVGAPFDETMNGDLKDVYNFMLARLEGMRDDRSIFLPNVIVSDPTTGMTHSVNLLKVDPFGNIQIINVITPKFSTKSEQFKAEKIDLGAESILKKKGIQDSLTQRMYTGLTMAISKRILENLGFYVHEGTMTINLVKEEGRVLSEGTTLHASSENKHVVDKIIPLDIAEENRAAVEEIMDQMRNPEEIEDWESEIFTEEGIDILSEENKPLYGSLFKALKNYKEGLIRKEDAIKNARNVIMMDKSRLHLIRQISMSRSMIENSFLNPETIDKVYIDLVKESIDQIDEFLDYIGDPDNFSKPEYIKKVLAWQKFVESYRGLVNITNADGLSQTQLAYIKKLSDKLNDIVGVLSSDKKIVKKGAIDIAIDNYVRQVIIDKSNRDFTDDELDVLMTTAKDIGYIEYQTGTMATSRDTILALMDKIFKRDKQIVLDRTQRRAPRIKRAAMKLAKLTGSPKIDYGFFIEFDENGVPTGEYTKKKGKQFKDKLNKLKEPLINKDGSWKEYIDFDDIEQATDEQIKWNQDLFAARNEYFGFKAAERQTEDGPRDGKYFKYTKEFKRARQRFEVFVANANGGGFWTKRASVSQKAYLRYVAKYYNTYGKEAKIARPIEDANGNFTGQVYYVDNATFVKQDFKEINYDSVEGKKMISEKWIKLNNPKTALEQAQLEYYNMFIDVFENELVNLLPENISMIGRLPVINGRPTSKLKDKPTGVGVIYSKMKTSVQNFFSPSTVIKKAFYDEHGDIIADSLPLMYTGSVVQQEEITEAYENLKDAQARYKLAKTSKEQVKIKEELRTIRGKIKTLEAKPTARTLNLDMTEVLLKFSAMAENYEVMSQSEDTFHAMLKVLENRTYTNAAGNVKVQDDEDKEIGGQQSGKMSNMYKRAHKWMKMVFYNNDGDTKTFFDKLAKGLITQTSLAYVGFNVFGNLNNYVFGRVSNAIETVGGRFFARNAMMKATGRFQRAMFDNLAGAVKSPLKKYRRYEDDQQKGKWNAMVMYMRMLDSKEDMRESGYKSENRSVRAAAKDMFTDGSDGVTRFLKAGWDRFHEFGYIIQDAGEYNVQSKIGNAIIESTTMKNSKTGETMSLWDAMIWDNKALTLKVKEGFDKVIFYNQTKERDWNDDARYELRNYIREVNIQVHGNYAHEDRMVMQSTAVGQLAAQFHKWVAPAIKTRFRSEYFDENLGWMEGRYLTFWNFMGYSFRNLNEMGSIMNNYKEFNGEKGQMKLQNVFRTMGEIGIIMTTVLLKMLLAGMINDDDDDERGKSFRADDSDSTLMTRLRNVFLYQLDRTHKDLVTFMPIPGTGGAQQMYQLFKSPIASSRTLGELGEALEYSVGTGLAWAFMDDEKFLESKWVYDRPKARRGKWKLGKQWGDALPILYTINRWKSYDNVTDFYIK